MTDPAINIVKIQQEVLKLTQLMRPCSQEDINQVLIAVGTISHHLQEIQAWIISSRLK